MQHPLLVVYSGPRGPPEGKVSLNHRIQNAAHTPTAMLLLLNKFPKTRSTHMFADGIQVHPPRRPRPLRGGGHAGAGAPRHPPGPARPPPRAQAPAGASEGVGGLVPWRRRVVLEASAVGCFESTAVASSPWYQQRTPPPRIQQRHRRLPLLIRPFLTTSFSCLLVHLPPAKQTPTPLTRPPWVHSPRQASF